MFFLTVPIRFRQSKLIWNVYPQLEFESRRNKANCFEIMSTLHLDASKEIELYIRFQFTLCFIPFLFTCQLLQSVNRERIQFRLPYKRQLRCFHLIEWYLETLKILLKISHEAICGHFQSLQFKSALNINLMRRKITLKYEIWFFFCKVIKTSAKTFYTSVS